MATVVGGALSSGRRQDLIPALEWDCLCRCRPNVLIECPADSTDSLVRLVEPHLRGPVQWTPAGMRLTLPERGSVVLQDVSALGRQEQAELFRWLGDLHDHRQVVALTTRPLFPWVSRGLFDEALYYRLNVMLLYVDSGLPE